MIRAWAATLALLAALVGCGDGGGGGHHDPTPSPTATSLPRAGTVDPSFATAGFAVTDFPGAAPDDVAYAVAVQPDGKIVAAGVSSPVEGLPTFAVARYLPDGTLDAAFEDGGRLVSRVGTAGIASDVVVAANGTVVVAGTVTEGFGLLRLEASGRPDTTFGDDGIVLGPGNLVSFSRVALQSDGRILVAGLVGPGTSNIGLFRYRGDGTLDPTFGVGGVVSTTAGSDVAVRALLVQSDGRILVGGSGSGVTTIGDGTFLLARYLGDGTLDGEFGDGGIVRTDVTPGARSRIVTLSVSADGGILALGVGGQPPRASGNGGALFLARYRPDGSLDASFGAGGIVPSAIAINDAAPIAVQADGKILIGDGLRFTGPASVRRLSADGSVDTAFGDDGIFAVHVRPNDDSAILALALQPDGWLVAAGYSRPPMATADFAAARLWVGGP